MLALVSSRLYLVCMNLLGIVMGVCCCGQSVIRGHRKWKVGWSPPPPPSLLHSRLANPRSGRAPLRGGHGGKRHNNGCHGDEEQVEGWNG